MGKYYLDKALSLLTVILLTLALISCEEAGEKIIEISPPSIILGSYNFIVDKEAHRVIFYTGEGDFLFYNYETNDITDHLSIGGNIKNCSLSENRTNKELFVTSVRDSAILVFDSQTLAPTDTFFFNGIPNSVVSKDSLLFVSLLDSPGGISMYVLGRKGKKIITNFAGSKSHLLTSMGSDDDINILLSQSSYYRYIRFNPDGSSFSSNTRRDFGNYLTSASIHAAPSGELFVTAGTIINDTLDVLGALPTYNYQTYGDFEFSNDSEYLFGTQSKFKKIHKYEIESLQMVDEYSTKGYPYRVFCDRNDDEHLYVLSTTEASGSNRRYKLEKISLTN